MSAAEPTSDAAEATTRIRLDIAYDGTDFNGWARQPGQRTVQGVIEAAFATILRRHPPAPSLVVAGRTDAGVHASGQVAHVDLTDEQLAAFQRQKRGKGKPKPQPEPGEAVAHRLRGILNSQPDVVVRAASVAPAGFDARFSAIWRRYRYRVADQQAVRDPLQRRHTSWHDASLDTAAMDEAAATLVGLHDFAAYCKSRPGATTIRTLQDFRWERDADGVLIASLQADAFCHSMVRALVGATVAVGEGKLAPGRLVDLRIEKSRTSAFKVMPARGLTLTQVGYPEDAELALRAVQTRARRELPTE